MEPSVDNLWNIQCLCWPNRGSHDLFHNHLWIACHVPGKVLRWKGKIELLSLGGCVERWNKCSVKDHGQGQDRKKAQLRSSGLTLSVSGRWDCLGFAEKASHLAKEWVGEHPHRMRNVPGLGLQRSMSLKEPSFPGRRVLLKTSNGQGLLW